MKHFVNIYIIIYVYIYIYKYAITSKLQLDC